MKSGMNQETPVRVVQKYGGTSVGTPRRIQKVADRIAARHAAGDQVIAVVSAMGQTTDQLQALAKKITHRPSQRETDMLLTAGERISMALLSMALDTRNVPAISFTGSQSGIITDTAHTRARILEIRPIRIAPELERGRVVIVAGFQGVSREKEVTTLGRGGSDTTAVALALGMQADRCEIYTDVPGVMTADPRLVPTSRLLRRVPWDTMLELSVCGAGVLHSRAAELARRRRVPVEVGSAFSKRRGTLIEGTPIEEDPKVVAVTGRPRVVRVHLSGPASASDRAALFEALDTVVDDTSGLHHDTATDSRHVVFHMPPPEGGETLERLAALARQHGAACTTDADHAAVTVVGNGLLDLPAVTARAERALSRAGITPQSLTTTPLSLTLLVPGASYEDAQRALHREFLEE
jgi:aspartate kinase